MKEFSSILLVQEKIDERKEQGFTSLRFPGGTSKDGMFYSGVIIHKYDEETKKIYFLCVPYDEKWHRTHPNGHNKRFGEKPEETATREIQEETDMHISIEDLELITKKTVEDTALENKGTGKTHIQYFYLLKNIPSNYHAPEYEGRNSIDEETTAPIWIPAKLFIEVIFKKHLDVVAMAFKQLRFKNAEYAYLMNLI